MGTIDTQWFIDNGERLARIEALLSSVNGERLAKIETLLSSVEGRKPCYACQNVGTLAKMKQNLLVVNWIGATFVGGALIAGAKWVIDGVAGRLSNPF